MGRQPISSMFYALPMKDTLKAVGLRIKEARKRADLNQAELGARVGVGQSVISDWERGVLGSWRDYMDPLTRALGVPPVYLVVENDAGPPVQPVGELEVVGEVQGGSFRLAMEYPPDERYTVPVVPPPGYERIKLRALKVVGPSVNLIYPDGTFVIVASAVDTDVRDGDKVVVYAHRGEVTEATIKELRIEADGRIVLWPRSTHPDHQEPIYLSAEDQAGPEIAYVVVGSYRPENRPPPPIAIRRRS